MKWVTPYVKFNQVTSEFRELDPILPMVNSKVIFQILGVVSAEIWLFLTHDFWSNEHKTSTFVQVVFSHVWYNSKIFSFFRAYNVPEKYLREIEKKCQQAAKAKLTSSFFGLK